ncbi:MAG TPA: rhomboid family intramembrane serine protease [Thermoleophilaceae bacterium]
MSEPGLFVVCKNCGSEVSPYVTECPYCGQRVRKRAPRLDRGEPAEEPRKRSTRTRKMPSLGRIRRDEIPGIAPDTRPYATIALIVVALAANVAIATDAVGFHTLGAVIFRPESGQWWRLVTTPFLHDNAGYELVALGAVAIFGTHLERRFGWLVPILLFLACGAVGAFAAVEYDSLAIVLGANGAALGMLCAWLVDDRLAARRGEDRGNDLLGVLVIAVVLLLLPIMTDQANAIAGIAGGLTGAALGVPLSLFVRR